MRHWYEIVVGRELLVYKDSLYYETRYCYSFREENIALVANVVKCVLSFSASITYKALWNYFLCVCVLLLLAI